jgi:hypothetical protein
VPPAPGEPRRRTPVGAAPNRARRQTVGSRRPPHCPGVTPGQSKQTLSDALCPPATRRPPRTAAMAPAGPLMRPEVLDPLRPRRRRDATLATATTDSILPSGPTDSCPRRPYERSWAPLQHPGPPESGRRSGGPGRAAQGPWPVSRGTAASRPIRPPEGQRRPPKVRRCRRTEARNAARGSEAWARRWRRGPARSLGSALPARDGAPPRGRSGAAGPADPIGGRGAASAGPP